MMLAASNQSKSLFRSYFLVDRGTYVRYSLGMSKGALRELDETIRRDRDEVRSGLLGTLPAGGKVDRDRLRWILDADRVDLFRTEGARNTAEFVSADFTSRNGRPGAG